MRVAVEYFHSWWIRHSRKLTLLLLAERIWCQIEGGAQKYLRAGKPICYGIVRCLVYAQQTKNFMELLKLVTFSRFTPTEGWKWQVSFLSIKSADFG